MNTIQKTLSSNGVKVNQFFTLQSSSDKAIAKRFENSILQADIVRAAKLTFESNKAAFSPVTKIDDFFNEAFGIGKAYAYRLIKLAENSDKLAEFRKACEANKALELGVNGFNLWLKKGDEQSEGTDADADEQSETAAAERQQHRTKHVTITLRAGVTLAELEEAIAYLQSMK